MLHLPMYQGPSLQGHAWHCMHTGGIYIPPHLDCQRYAYHWLNIVLEEVLIVPAGIDYFISSNFRGMINQPTNQQVYNGISALSSAVLDELAIKVIMSCIYVCMYHMHP